MKRISRAQKLVLTPRGERVQTFLAGALILTAMAITGLIEGGAL